MSQEITNRVTGRFVLSGASGLVGSALRAALVQRGASVVQLVRGEPATSGEVRWNPEGGWPEGSVRVLEGADAAIHLGGANLAARRWTAAYRREVFASRVDSTRVLATALAGLSRPPRALLVASAVGIYGDRGDEVLDETSSSGSGFLADLCRAWEGAAEPAAAAGIRVVPLRFGVVLARGAGALEKMLPVFRLGLGGRLGSGRQWMSWIAAPDLVEAVLFILGAQAVKGPVNVTSPQPVTNAEFTRALGRCLHRPTLLPAPAVALRLALGPMAEEALLASARAVPRKLLEAGLRFELPAIEGALRAVIE